MKDPHEIPLCPQALVILKELHELTGHGRFCFPNTNKRNRSMSENTLSAALRALGFEGEEMTVQGFRTLASTLLNEAGIDPALIGLQLAHLERNKSRRAYNHAKRMVARRKLMDLWAICWTRFVAASYRLSWLPTTTLRHRPPRSQHRSM